VPLQPKNITSGLPYLGEDNVFFMIPPRENTSYPGAFTEYYYNIPVNHLPGIHWCGRLAARRARASACGAAPTSTQGAVHPGLQRRLLRVEGITSSGSGGSLPLRRSTRPRLTQAGAAPQVPPAPEGLVHAAADVGVGRDHRGGRPALAVARGLRAAAAAAAEPGARPSAHAPLSSAHRRHLCPAGPGGFGRGAVPHAAMLA